MLMSNASFQGNRRASGRHPAPPEPQLSLPDVPHQRSTVNTAEVLHRPPQTDHQPFFLASLIREFTEPVRQFWQRLTLREQPVSAAENYVRRFFPEENRADHDRPSSIETSALTTRAERAQALWFDLSHTIREMVQVELETEFSYTMTTESLTGDGYSDDLTTMLANFAHELGNRGLAADRGQVETVVFQRVYHQLFAATQNWVDHQPPSALENITAGELPPLPFMALVTSPPDTFAAGYHGIDTLHNWNGKEKHHTFHFGIRVGAIELDASTDASKPKLKSLTLTTTQFRTWHNIQGLLDLHRQLGVPLSPTTDEPITNQLIANHQLHFFDENTPIDEQLAFFRDKLYQDAATWERRPDQVPQLEAETLVQFWEEVTSFFQLFYLSPLLDLLDRHTPQTVVDPKRRQRLIAQINLRTDIFLRGVELRIRELNINPQYAALVKKNLLRQLWLQPDQWQQIQDQIAQVENPNRHPSRPLTQKVDDTLKTYTLIEKAQIFGQQLNERDALWLGQHTSGIIALGNFAFGSAQCYSVGALKLPVEVAKLAQTANFAAGLTELSTEIDIEVQRQLLQDLEQADYQELDLRSQGATQVWMVPASYLEKPGCRVAPDGTVCGPCITPDFPHGIPLDHPLEKANPLGPLPMNRFQFERYLQTLRESILAHQIENQLNIEDLSDSEQTKAQGLISRLTRQIFKVNLSTVVAGVTEYGEGAGALTQEQLQRLTSIAELEQFVLELEQDSDDQSHEQLEKLEYLAAIA